MFSKPFSNLPGWGFRNPSDQLGQLRRQLDELYERVFRESPFRGPAAAGVIPLINVTEDSNAFYVRAELPGVKAADLDLQAVDQSLTISGELKIPSEGDQACYHRREREAGKFSRVITLPGQIDTAKVAARLENGLLTVTLPKAETAKPRQIQVT